MAYTVFEDESEIPLPQKSKKSTLKKLKSLEKLSNGHAETNGSPVASTSKSAITSTEETARPTTADNNEEAPAVFKKRKASVIGSSTNGDAPQSKKRNISDNNHGGEGINGTEMSVDSHKELSASEKKGKSRESTPIVTSKRVRTFYAEDEDASDDEATTSLGKGRGIQALPGESKKQARKRIQSERKDKADHLLASRQKLPVYFAKDAILKEIEALDTVIILGETGSGKTTRMSLHHALSKIPTKLCITSMTILLLLQRYRNSFLPHRSAAHNPV
jgi:HrpA-like RNA helicase